SKTEVARMRTRWERRELMESTGVMIGSLGGLANLDAGLCSGEIKFAFTARPRSAGSGGVALALRSLVVRLAQVGAEREKLFLPNGYCRTTLSPSFKPPSNSVLAPLEMPTCTGTFLLPSFALGSGTSTDAFLSLS